LQRKRAQGPPPAPPLSMVAEMERKFILERQRAGIEDAKAKGGVYKGRKPSVPVEEVRLLRGEGKKGRPRSLMLWACPV
jgi:DNA invertase Pin-like site-specific DNA recombinase